MVVSGVSFRGVSACNVDAKGRFAMPTKYRESFQETSSSKCVITIDTEDDCLLLYPLQVWEEIEASLQSLPSLNRKVRRIQRLLIGHASEVEIDAQGRVLLPTILRQFAHVKKKMMVVGQGKKFELWSEENWLSACKAWLEQGKTMQKEGEEIPDELSSISV